MSKKISVGDVLFHNTTMNKHTVVFVGSKYFKTDQGFDRRFDKTPRKDMFVFAGKKYDGYVSSGVVDIFLSDIPQEEAENVLCVSKAYKSIKRLFDGSIIYKFSHEDLKAIAAIIDKY